MDIRAVLFDCDGLMFDTEIVANEIWRFETSELGIELPADFFARITGSGGGELQEYLESVPGLAEALPQLRAKRFDLDFWRSIHTDCLNRPGLFELFFWLKENGYQTAVCSSSPRAYIDALLQTTSRRMEFDMVVCGDMVKHAKPDPEIFLTAAANLGIEPKNCIVLEDSKLGIIAAKRAGMHACFVPDTIALDKEMEEAIEYTCGSLADVIPILQRAEG